MASVCVLIPTKNRKRLLERALKSLEMQTVTPDEVIIVNDGSEDGTKSFLDEYKSDFLRMRVIHRAESGGVNVARHQGIEASCSDWIAVLDDDDEFYPDAIEKIKKKLSEVPLAHYIIFFNSMIQTDQGLKNGGFQFKGEEYYDLNYEEMMTKHRMRGDCKPVFRKALFEEGYRFPITVNGLESYLFYLAARDGKGIRCYPEVTTLIHFESDFAHLSHVGPRKNPFPMLVIHLKQIPEHYKFYFSHPAFFKRKLVEMIKLSIRSILGVFR